MINLHVNGFIGEFRFLSNFHYVNVEYEGLTYRTTEHAYQAAKCDDILERRYIQSLKTPAEAKKAGRLAVLRPTWDEEKYQIMYDLNAQKFANEPLRSMLLQTGLRYLEETNTWGDTYWGVCGGKGENKLGFILMDIRDKLRGYSD